MIDWARVAELRDEIGAEDFDEVLTLFLTEVDGAVAGLEAGGLDAGAIAEQMHFLKGAALNLGFAALAELAATGEKAAMAGDGAAVPAPDVRRCLEASRAGFEAEFPARFAA